MHSIFSFFKEKKPSVDTLKDPLLSATRDLINRNDLVSAYFVRFNDLTGKSSEEEYIRLYLSLEKFVLTNVPPVVTKQFHNAQELRSYLVGQVTLDKIFQPAQVLFLSPQQRKDFVYQSVLQDISAVVSSSLGLNVFNTVISQKKEYKEILFELYQSIASNFGTERALNIFQAPYQKIKNRYGFELRDAVETTLPEIITEVDRYSLLSREELEDSVAIRTKELNSVKVALEAKVVEFEKQNKLLVDRKSAMINLLEDARKLESDLRVERDRSQSIILSMGEGLLTVDSDANLTIINPTAEKLLGVKADDYIGKPWSSIVTTLKGDADIPIEERTFSQALKEGKAIVTEMDANHYYKRIDGKIFPVVSITAPLKSGNKIIGAVKVFRDATHEKKQKEEIEALVVQRTKQLNEKNTSLRQAQEQISLGWLEIQDQKTRLSTSINSLPLGFVLFDTEEKVLLVNPKVKSILSINSEISTLDEIDTLLQPSVNVLNLLLKCKAEKTVIEIPEVTYKTKFLRLFIVPIVGLVNKEERNIGAAILLEDITEAKVLERSKDEFFSIASHELRTPLTAIRGNTSMIMDYFHSEIKDQNLKDIISDIHESSLRLISIVNEFLDVSRLEQNRLQFKIEELDILAISQSVVDELSPTISPGVILSIIPPTTLLPHVKGDLNKTKEVLINLLGNALKFTEKGSISVTFVPEGEFVAVNIIDTGRGIPLANQNLLFRKFQQAGSSLFTRDTTKGTGLGLYISKLMMQGMGGTIRLVSSQEGKGSTFAFALHIW